MDMRLTTLVHNGTVFTIGSRDDVNFLTDTPTFSAEVTIANGSGISYPQLSRFTAATEDEAILLAMNAILAEWHQPSYILCETSGWHQTHVRTLDEALAMIDDVERDIILAEL
jgi:hypothetical protein